MTESELRETLTNVFHSAADEAGFPEGTALRPHFLFTLVIHELAYRLRENAQMRDELGIPANPDLRVVQ